MHPFEYGRVRDAGAAIATADSLPHSAFLAGGTSLVDLMKEGVERPAALVDINAVPLAEIALKDETLTLGALATNSDVAHHATVVSRVPVLSQALLSGASPQLRNMATVGGNLLQRTRCPYFRDTGFERCNKRQPGTGCGARDGYHRTHAILGGSQHCIATHPSDMAVALVALDAAVHTLGSGGARVIPLVDFYFTPGDHPERENVLQHGELITAVTIAAKPWLTRSVYVKARDRAAYEFALASAAVALHLADGRIREARVALGGVGTVPWRAHLAEQALVGQAPNRIAFERAADAELAQARPLRDNAFKLTLARNVLVRACEQAMALPGGHS